MHGPGLRRYWFLSWWQSAESQYCMLAKENSSLNLIQKKISGALPSLLHAASSQTLGISVQGEPSAQGCWTEGRDEGKRDPCKDSGTTLIILCEPTNQTAVEKGLSSLLQRCKRSKQPLSSLMLQSKLQTLHSWSWAACRPIKKSKLHQTKCNPSCYFSLSIRTSGCSKAALLLQLSWYFAEYNLE